MSKDNTMAAISEWVNAAKTLLADNLSLTSTATRRAENWLKENYECYPKGIDRVYDLNSTVTIRLSEPLNIDRLASIVEAKGYHTEVDMENGNKVLSFFTRKEYPSGRVQTLLEGTFHEKRNIKIGMHVIDPEEGDVNPRLLLLREYLEREVPELTQE